MSFKIPSGYEDFVTSADDLLNEFSREPIDADKLSYRMYFDPEHASQGVRLALSVRHDILAFVHSQTHSDDGFIYIWNRQPFSLHVRVNTDASIYLAGQVEFGNNIEDEWFATYLLLQISKKYPFLSIAASDGDGEYLLIETAEYLPDWVSPFNCANRVWIRNGSVHIVPLDCPGRLKEGGVMLDRALQALRSSASDTIASKKVQNALSQRLAGYPIKCRAVMHTCACILPSKVASILHSNPQLVANAVHALSVSRAEGAKHSKTSFFSDDTTDFAIVQVRLSRALYAQLTFFQNFRAPSAFEAIASQSLSKEQRKALDIGARLTVGLEVARGMSLAERHPVVERDWRVEAQSVLDSSMTAEALQHAFASGAINSPETFDLREAINCASRRSEELPPDASMREERMLDSVSSLNRALSGALRCRPLAPKPFAVTSPLPSSDSDAWLHFTPEEFEKELHARVSSLGAPATTPFDSATVASTSHVSVPQGASEAQGESAEELNDLVRGFEKFFGAESDVGGVAMNASEEEEERDVSEGVQIDMDRLVALLQQAEQGEEQQPESVEDIGIGDDGDESDGDGESGSDSETGDAPVHGDTVPTESATTGCKAFVVPHASMDVPGDEGVVESEEDSDDELDSEDSFYARSEEGGEGGEAALNEDELDEEFFDEYSVSASVAHACVRSLLSVCVCVCRERWTVSWQARHSRRHSSARCLQTAVLAPRMCG